MRPNSTLLEADLLTEENRVLLPLHYVYPGVIGMLTSLATGLPIKKFMLDFRAGSR